MSDVLVRCCLCERIQIWKIQIWKNLWQVFNQCSNFTHFQPTKTHKHMTVKSIDNLWFYNDVLQVKNLSTCTVFSSLTARVESDGALNSLTASSEQLVMKIMEWTFTRSYNVRKMLVSFLLSRVLLCQSDRHWVRQTPQSTVLHTVTHSPREEDQPHPWKEAVRSFIMLFFSATHCIQTHPQSKSSLWCHL